MTPWRRLGLAAGAAGAAWAASGSGTRNSSRGCCCNAASTAPSSATSKRSAASSAISKAPQAEAGQIGQNRLRYMHMPNYGRPRSLPVAPAQRRGASRKEPRACGTRRKHQKKYKICQ